MSEIHYIESLDLWMFSVNRPLTSKAANKYKKGIEQGLKNIGVKCPKVAVAEHFEYHK